MESLVNFAVDVFLEQPKSDDRTILASLALKGVQPAEAWRLYQFVPIAFCRIMLAGSGVGFEPAYISLHPGTQARERWLFSDEPLYVAAVAVAEAWKHRGSLGAQWLAIAGRSAEFQAINQLLHRGSKLSAIRLMEPILFEYMPAS